MDQSPAVPSPQKGDPITADWAQKVADAANAVPHTPEAPGAFASPFGSVPALAPQPMLGVYAPVMPFDVRIVWNGTNSTYDVLCAMPEPTYGHLVFAYGTGILRESGGTGTLTKPWVKVGSVSANTNAWLVLALTPPTRTDGVVGVRIYKWQVELQVASSYSLPAWAWGLSPVIPIAQIKVGSEPQGFVQFVRGVIHIGTPAMAPYAVAANLRINSIGDAQGNEWLGQYPGGGGRTDTVARNLNLGVGDTWYGSYQIQEATIVDGNGVSHKILELVTPSP